MGHFDDYRAADYEMQKKDKIASAKIYAPIRKRKVKKLKGLIKRIGVEEVLMKIIEKDRDFYDEFNNY